MKLQEPYVVTVGTRCYLVLAASPDQAVARVADRRYGGRTLHPDDVRARLATCADSDLPDLVGDTAAVATWRHRLPGPLDEAES